MKVSDNTKTAVSKYIEDLKEKIEEELEIDLAPEVFSSLSQALTNNQHEMECAALLHSLEIEANELGYTLVKLPKDAKDLMERSK